MLPLRTWIAALVMFEKPGRKRSNTDIGWDNVFWMRGGLRLPRNAMVARAED
jgi:hypothetical protein